MINSRAHSLLLIEKIDEQFIDVERWALSSLNTVVRPCLMEHLGDRLTPTLRVQEMDFHVPVQVDTTR